MPRYKSWVGKVTVMSMKRMTISRSDRRISVGGILIRQEEATIQVEPVRFRPPTWFLESCQLSHLRLAHPHTSIFPYINKAYMIINSELSLNPFFLRILQQVLTRSISVRSRQLRVDNMLTNRHHLQHNLDEFLSKFTIRQLILTNVLINKVV